MMIRAEGLQHYQHMAYIRELVVGSRVLGSEYLVDQASRLVSYHTPRRALCQQIEVY